MSRKIIEHNISSFLESDRSEVLAVYGGWGVGKTYLWNEVVKHKSARISDCFTSYAYICESGVKNLI